MSYALAPATTLSEAWLSGLEHAIAAPRGRMVHLMMTITNPGSEIEDVRAGIDSALGRAGSPSVDTVAHTIFPREMYRDPGRVWDPFMPDGLERELDTAADDLYEQYLTMLPLLLTASGNRSGTYFSRMVSWPGKEAGGVNQLALRISRLRGERRNGRSTHNALDVDLAADCLGDVAPVGGIQVYAATDKRIRGFPCLVHLDFTLFDDVLHCTAVYRHQYLVTKAYGNLVGLSWLMQFLCQNSGFEIGELVVHATLADAEPGHRARPRDLVAELLPALPARYLRSPSEFTGSSA